MMKLLGSYNSRREDSPGRSSGPGDNVDPNRRSTASDGLISEVASLHGQVEESLKEVKVLKTTNMELEERLKAKEAELLTLKNCLSTHDEHSESDVAQLLDRIRGLTEALVSNAVHQWALHPASEAKTNLSKKQRETVEHVLSPQLVATLQAVSFEDECAIALLQLALQSLVSEGIWFIIHRFSFASPNLPERTEADRVFQNLAAKVKELETPAMYANWRSTTHKHLRHNLSASDADQRLDLLSEWVSHNCFDTACLLASDSRPALHTFLETFEPQVKEISSEAFKLSCMIREDIISRDLQPIRPYYGAKVDGTSVELEEGFPLLPDDVVVCVTNVGLGTFAASKTAPEGVLRKARVLSKGALNRLIQSTGRVAA